MLEAFKNMTGGKGKLVQQQSDELDTLITTAREERSALSAMLTALTARSAKLAPLGKTLEEVDKRIQALKESARQAEQTTQKALGPDGELQKHREAVQHLSSQALGTQAMLETLKKERAALEGLRGQLRDTESEVKQSLGHSTTLKTE